MASPQLIFRLALRDDATFDNYYAGSNGAIIDALQRGVRGDGERMIYLWGAGSVGRSHLLQACCHAMDDRHTVAYIDLKEYEDFSTEILAGLEAVDLVCLDNINAVLNRSDWEEALFHFYNRCRDQQRRLIVSGLSVPSQLPCELADLRSRLAWGLVFQIKPLDDTQKVAALMMRAKRRGMVLVDTAAQYLLHHSPRDLTQLFGVLDRLEKASLVEQRRITIPFIKSVISR